MGHLRPAAKTTTVDSPVGQLTLVAHDGHLTGLHMQDQRHAPTDTSSWERDDAAFADAVAQLEAYFAGRLTRFDLPIRLHGSDFQRHVWAALREIPYGRTLSYAQIAARVGAAQAYRAVGLANGRNPVGIIVPCHRVIGANGALTGYGGGLERKRWLLEHESRSSPQLVATL